MQRTKNNVTDKSHVSLNALGHVSHVSSEWDTCLMVSSEHIDPS